jgi:hypothetical protein
MRRVKGFTLIDSIDENNDDVVVVDDNDDGVDL